MRGFERCAERIGDRVRAAFGRPYDHRVGGADAGSGLKQGLSDDIGGAADVERADACRQRAGIVAFRQVADRDLCEHRALTVLALRRVAEGGGEAQPRLLVDAGQRHVVEMLQRVDVAEARLDLGRERVGRKLQAFPRRFQTRLRLRVSRAITSFWISDEPS